MVGTLASSPAGPQASRACALSRVARDSNFALRSRGGETPPRQPARRQRSDPYFTPNALLIASIVNWPSGPKPMTWPLMMYVGVERIPLSKARLT